MLTTTQPLTFRSDRMTQTLTVGLVQQRAWPDKAKSLDETEAG